MPAEKKETTQWFFVTIAPKLQDVSYEDTGLKSGATYYYRVQAKGRDGLISKESETVTVETLPTQ